MLIELFELATNSALEYDLQTQARIKQLEGKTMTFTILPIKQGIHITCTPEGVEYSNEINDQVDVSLSTTIPAMIRISRHGFEGAKLRPGELEISGDPIVGQRFAQIIAELDIDWNSLLVTHLGEAPARLINTATDIAKNVSQQSGNQLKQFFKHLAEQELQLTVSADEVDEFLDGVDTLRADTERLSLRIQRIQSKS